MIRPRDTDGTADQQIVYSPGLSATISCRLASKATTHTASHEYTWGLPSPANKATFQIFKNIFQSASNLIYVWQFSVGKWICGVDRYGKAIPFLKDDFIGADVGRIAQLEVWKDVEG